MAAMRPPRADHLRGLLQHVLQLVELGVHRDAERLEDAGQGLDHVGGRHAIFYHRRQGPRRVERAGVAKGPGDLSRPRLLPVLAKHIAQVTLAPAVDDLLCSEAALRVHSHVERALVPEAKAPLGRVDLMGRDAEVEQQPVDGDQVLGRQHVP
jgi:hypothetical protein